MSKLVVLTQEFNRFFDLCERRTETKENGICVTVFSSL